MTLSREQAQALARLIHTLRTSWHEEGIYASLAKCQQLDPFEVTLAAVRAARDPKAKTPGVIPANGSHWNEPEPAPRSLPKLSREQRRALTCAECGRYDGCAPACEGFVPLDQATRGRARPPADLRDQIHRPSRLERAHEQVQDHCRDARHGYVRRR